MIRAPLSRILAPVAATALALAPIVLSGCLPEAQTLAATTSSAATTPAAGTATPPATTNPPCHQAMPSAAPAKASIYDLPVHLTDQRGVAVDLGVDRGHPVLISMFYGTCKQACPLLIHDIQGIVTSLSPAAQQQIRVVLVSFDPARDTPTALATLAKERGLDSRWSLLTTDADQVRDVAAVLGFQYRQKADGDFDHSSVVSLLDGDGVIRYRLENVGADARELVTAANALVP